MADEKKPYLGEYSLPILWNLIKAKIPTKTSELTNDAEFLKPKDIAGKLDATGDGKDVTVTFTNAQSRGNIINGEKMSTMIGKIAKFFEDTKAIAFTGDYNDLSNAPTIPTDNAELQNGAGYQTAEQVNAAIKSAISGITEIDFQVVTSLPDAGENGTIYLISNGGASGNSYDEYIYIADTGKFEKIGTTEVDLTGYLKSDDLTEMTEDEIKAIIV